MLIPELRSHPDERVLLEVRKHWFVFLVAAGTSFALILLPFVAAILLSAFGPSAIALFGTPYWTIFAALWLLLTFMHLATVWTEYVLDSIIVTEKRVIFIEQKALFSREVVSLRLELVQDVTVDTEGIFATLLTYGTVHAETAGAEANLAVMHGIPDPGHVKDVILQQSAVCIRERGGR
ncbi:MAG TPA: PH domain-containing protein [Candidatus Paceibacterota bacterium]|nr:PH domain-containing protein [Candidatus Paceibacterota bacterium]